MKKMILVILFFFTLIACNENSTSPINETKATFSIKLASNATSLPKSNYANSFNMTDMGGTIFTITEARANVRHIQFDYPAEDSRSQDTDSTNQISIDGPFVIDLMNGTSNPEITPFNIDAGTYKRIDVRLDDTKPIDGLVTQTDQLFDNTLVVKGNFEYDGNANRTFSFILKFNENVRFENANGFVVAEGGVKDILLNLKIEEWFQNIDLTSCMDNSEITFENNGDLIIDDKNNNSDCSNFENTIKHNIKNNYDIK